MLVNQCSLSIVLTAETASRYGRSTLLGKPAVAPRQRVSAVTRVCGLLGFGDLDAARRLDRVGALLEGGFEGADVLQMTLLFGSQILASAIRTHVMLSFEWTVV